MLWWLQTISHGTIPYLGTFLTDLTMIDTAIPDFVGEEKLINFDKRRREFEILAQVWLFAQLLGWNSFCNGDFRLSYCRVQQMDTHSSWTTNLKSGSTQSRSSTTRRLTTCRASLNNNRLVILTTQQNLLKERNGMHLNALSCPLIA